MLQLMASGFTMPATGKELGISYNTVKMYLTRTYETLGAANVAHAVALAAKHGILDLSEIEEM